MLPLQNLPNTSGSALMENKAGVSPKETKEKLGTVSISSSTITLFSVEVKKRGNKDQKRE